MSSYDTADGDLSSLFHDPHENDCPLKLHKSSSYEYTIQRISQSLWLTDGTKHHSLWGNNLWNSSVEAAKCVEQIDDIAEKSVLELGAGLGLPSIVAAFLGAANVVATDYPDDELISTLESNISTNCADEPIKPPTVQSLLWGNPDDIAKVLGCNGNRRFDIIILSDLIFNHICHTQLSFTILELLNTTGKCICTYGHHVPSRANKDLAFFDVAAQFRLVARDVRQVEYELSTVEAKEREVTSLVFVREIAFESPHPPLATSPQTVNSPVVIIGTSLFHTLVAFFLSQAGTRVLTFDEQPFYGDRSSTLHLMDLYLMCRRKGLPFHFSSRGESLLQSTLRIDLHPMLLPAGSAWVDFLIDEGVETYVEFEPLAAVGMIYQDQMVKLPMTKSAIFASEKLSFVEKRKLCRFLAQWGERAMSPPLSTNEDGGSDEKFINLLNSLELSPVLHRWITHVVLHLETHQIETISTVEIAEKLAELGLHQSADSSTYSIPTYGQLDLAEGILRRAFLKGLTSMVGQGIYSITKHSSAQAPSWTIRTSDYEIQTPIIVKHSSTDDDCSSILIGAKRRIRLGHGEEQTFDDNTLTIIPEGETQYNPQCVVHIFTASKLDGTVWTYHLRSKCPFQELVRFGEMWVETKFDAGDVLFSCGWNRTIFDHAVVESVNGANVISTDQSDGIYCSANMLHRAEKLAQTIRNGLA